MSSMAIKAYHSSMDLLFFFFFFFFFTAHLSLGDLSTLFYDQKSINMSSVGIRHYAELLLIFFYNSLMPRKNFTSHLWLETRDPSVSNLALIFCAQKLRRTDLLQVIYGVFTAFFSLASCHFLLIAKRVFAAFVYHHVFY